MRRVLFALLVVGSVGYGAEAQSPRADRATELVQQLGSSTFRVRDTAARDLMKMGLAAKPALLDAIKNPDLEIRLRSHELLVRLLQVDFETRLADLLADTDDERPHDLPGWKKYRQTVGGDVEARKLYVAMARAEPGLLEALDEGKERVTQVFTVRSGLLQASMNQDVSGNVRSELDPATVAAMLFIGSLPELSDNNVTGSQVFSLLHNETAIQAVRGGAHSRIMRRLLSDWIVSTATPNMGYYGLTLALRHNLKEAGLEAARKLLKQSATASHMVQHAAVAIGRFGSQEDVPLLEKFLKDQTICHTWHNGNQKVVQTQIRDVVLCMTIHLAGRDPRQFGFETLNDNPETIYHIYSLGFADNAKRDAAFAKWRATGAGESGGKGEGEKGSTAKPASQP